jgi:hypothetical protein
VAAVDDPDDDDDADDDHHEHAHGRLDDEHADRLEHDDEHPHGGHAAHLGDDVDLHVVESHVGAHRDVADQDDAGRDQQVDRHEVFFDADREAGELAHQDVDGHLVRDALHFDEPLVGPHVVRPARSLISRAPA